MGNSLGRVPFGGSNIVRKHIAGRTGFQDKLHHGECAEKLCAQDLSSGVQTLGDSFVGEAVGTGFSGQIASVRLS